MPAYCSNGCTRLYRFVDRNLILKRICFRLLHLTIGLESFATPSVLLLLRDHFDLQFAYADEHNNYKSGCDQLFHTRVKPFNVLHPNSIFASQPEVLQLDSLDILDIEGESRVGIGGIGATDEP